MRHTYAFTYTMQVGCHCFPKYLEKNILNQGWGVSLIPPKSELTGESELGAEEAKRP